MKILNKIIILSTLIILTGCDYKDMANYVTKTVYNQVLQENKNLKLEIEKLKVENKSLISELDKYKNGFKRMYNEK